MPGVRLPFTHKKFLLIYGSLAQLVEHLPSNAVSGVRIPVGHQLISGIFNLIYDPLAQSAEHLTFNQGVPRSSRGWITNGEVSERFKELVLKTSDLKGAVGSNPTLSAKNNLEKYSGGSRGSAKRIRLGNGAKGSIPGPQ